MHIPKPDSKIRRDNLAVRLKATVFILSFILLFVQQSIAQPDNLHFERFGIDDGMSSGKVTCIYQDNLGYMWFGTADGLNRFDGYHFKVYWSDHTEKSSLSSNSVWSFYEDTNETFWIGTANGLNKYDPSKDSFVSYRQVFGEKSSLGGGAVRAICEDRFGRLWIGNWDGGLNLMNREEETFGHYFHDPDNPQSISSNIVTSIVEDSQGILWIGTWGGGLNRYNPESDNFIRYRYDKNKQNCLGSDEIYSLYLDKQDNLWICTRGGGLNLYQRESDSFVSYKYNSETTASISTNSVRFIFEDNSGIYWIAPVDKDGLVQFDRNRNLFTNYQEEPGNPNSLLSAKFYCMFEDNSGLLWFGSDDYGINMFDRRTTQFVHFSKNLKKPNSLNDNTIYSIFEDHSGVLWVGTASEGLNCFDKERKRVTYFKKDDTNPQSINYNVISRIYEDLHGNLWLGLWGGGLDCLDRKRKNFMHYVSNKNNPHSLSNDYVTDIIEDRNGYLWIATVQGGLNRFDPKNQTFKRYEPKSSDNKHIKSRSVLCLWEDRKGTIWIGLNGAGLNRYDPTREVFDHYWPNGNDSTSISNGVIRCVCEDETGTMWFGTEEGLNKFNKSSGTFTKYRKKDGLVSEMIHGILEDDHGNLWISTSKGINKFDPRTETFTNYDKQDGLQSNEFLHAALFKGKDGKMYFGGVNGFNVFYPDSIKQNDFIPPVVLTNFLLFNKPVPIQQNNEASKSGFVLSQSIATTSEIVLNYTDYIFAFEFSALNYRQSKKNRFAYMLEGFDKKWVYVDYTDRKAVYTNIPPGEYVFCVKASNDDGVWNEKGTSIKVIILPPWWKTWWARSLAVFLLITGAITAYLWRVNQLKTRQRELESQVKERTSEVIRQKEEIEIQNRKLIELDHFKKNMTGMIVHDLKNPLNAMLNFSPNQSRDNLIYKMRNFARQMLTMVLNILDVQKFDDAKIVLEKQNIAIVDVIDSAMNQVQFLSQQKDIVITNDLSPNWKVEIDRDMGERIFVNLLTNGIKYTPHNGCIRITGREIKEGLFRFEVCDTGEGISPEHLDLVFDRFNQENARQSGQIRSTGLGLTFCKMAIEAHGGEIGVESEVGKGSTFFFTLTGMVDNGCAQTLKSISKSPESAIQFNPSDKEKEILKPLIERLSAVMVYESSQIKNILKDLNTDNSKNIESWKHAIENASYTMNEEQYKNLLNQFNLKEL